ncbi:mannosyltransferase putative-domain-containing protein [Kockovaella imperatae]|uniref:Mannosyltransferase putative-domain-containing protein n=1 Tax=Kockovaella imperatae TaxID=4999 RepID=A0A1Y1UN76_9TREE|nr:mannosyltransferase putative-domain-containing protein [Kockovaella imperatae]ORX38967.1 mannosyltransferase putative-domain-containing protein [Kockovaella imperatae]
MTTLFHTQAPHPARKIRPTISRPSPEQYAGFTIEIADAHFDLGSSDAGKTRTAHSHVVSSLPDYTSFEHLYHGRGIVILAGGRYAQYATTSLNVLRIMGSKLPVEIWIKDESEHDILWAKEVEKYGAKVRMISDYAPIGSVWDWFNPTTYFGKPVPWSPYQLKTMAILFSKFEQVLFLDADSVPIRDPEELFESTAYRDTGALIWPDLWPSIASSWLPYLIGLTPARSDKMWHEQTAESGQMIWNKKMHWKSLLLACYYNFYGQGFWYTAITGSGQGWGDKDTYLVALQALEEPYHIVHKLPERFPAWESDIPIINLQFKPNEPIQAEDTLEGEEEDLDPEATIASSPSPTTSATSPGTSPIPAFAHACGGIKWGLGEFAEAYHSSTPWSLFSKFTSPRYSHLSELLSKGERVLSVLPYQTEEDVELQLWRGLEHAACWSRAMGSLETCLWTRERLRVIFDQSVVSDKNIHEC